MNREDIIRMAREAGMTVCRDEWVFGEMLERFADLVATAEREAIEKIDWTALLRQGAMMTRGDAETLADRVVGAIRARGQA